jgi:uncharacterized membrane protein
VVGFAISMLAVQAVAAVAVLCVLIAVGFWVMARFRDCAAGDQESPSEVLRNFQEMRRQGDISEAEFRTIQSVAGGGFDRELNDSGDEG